MTSSRAVAAAVIAAITVGLVATHVFSHFNGVRVKAVRQTIVPTSSQLRIPVKDDRLAGLHAPFAVIARIENSSAAEGEFGVTVDGSVVCRRTVDARRSQRVDCVATAPLSPGPEHEVIIDARPGAWALQYLELASHHGGTIGAHELVILPAASRAFEHPGPLHLIVVWLLVTAILRVHPPRGMPRWLRVTHGAVAAILAALVAGSLVSQWISPYRVIFSAKTAVAWLLLVSAPRLWVLAAALLRVDSDARRGARAARAAVVAVLVCAVYAALVAERLRDRYHGNYSGFLQISQELFERNPLLSRRDDVRRALILQEGGGYDGQFMYFATFDPFLQAYRDHPSTYAEIMDAVPYRYGRIGFSVLTRALSAGRWQLYPAIMMWLILLGIAVTAFLLSLLAQGRQLTPAWGLLVLAVPGFWESLQTGLPEPLAAAALVGGIACVWQRRWILAGVLFGGSLLVRETGIVAVGCVLAAAAMRSHWRPAAVAALLGCGALLAWRLYVANVLYANWGHEALLFHPPDLGLPFAGFIDLWRAIARGLYYPGVPELARAGIVYPILLIAALAAAIVLAVGAPSDISVAAVFYGLMAVCLNFSAIWVHVGNGQRGTYEVFLMLALACVAVPVERTSLRRALLGFWVASACYVFLFAFDAADIRGTLPLPF